MTLRLLVSSMRMGSNRGHLQSLQISVDTAKSTVGNCGPRPCICELFDAVDLKADSKVLRTGECTDEPCAWQS